MEACGAAAFFDGAVAGEIQLPFACVGWEEFGEKFGGVLRVVLQDGAKAFRFGRFGLVQAGYAVFGGAVSDVFVVGGAGLFLSQQHFAVGVRDDEWSLREVQDVAGFQFGAELSGEGASRGQCYGDEARGAGIVDDGSCVSSGSQHFAP